MILNKTEGRFSRYYITKNVDNISKIVIGLLREKLLRRIILFLFLYPEHTRADIANDLGKTASTISHHLKKLLEYDIIERDRKGRKFIYRIKDQLYIYKLLILYEHSLSEDIIVTYLLNWVKYAIPNGYPTSYKRGKRKDIDEIYKNLLEIFSHPYHI
ncbi:MAG: ArsR family transcriptional regulator [Candidatus Lokiarchaeota archaeon]|nr:ArsR family transcriptional regulator [Candidatus Lokiarchaeota archaeon]